MTLNWVLRAGEEVEAVSAEYRRSPRFPRADLAARGFWGAVGAECKSCVHSSLTFPAGGRAFCRAGFGSGLDVVEADLCGN